MHWNLGSGGADPTSSPLYGGYTTMDCYSEGIELQDYLLFEPSLRPSFLINRHTIKDTKLRVREDMPSQVDDKIFNSVHILSCHSCWRGLPGLSRHVNRMPEQRSEMI